MVTSSAATFKDLRGRQKNKIYEQLSNVQRVSQDLQDSPLAPTRQRLGLQQARDLDQNTLAVILAGGQENHELARSGTLAAFPYGPNQKVCDVSIAQLLKSGVNKIHVMTQFNSHKLNKHLSTRYSPQFFGVQGGYLEYNQACQTTDGSSWYKGSADALRRSLGIILSRTDYADTPQDIIVCSAKQLHDVDYTKLVGAHRTRNADITIASIDVDAVDACSMGILSTDPPFSKVSNLAEKPGIQAAVYLAHHASTREPHLSKPHQATLVHASTGIYVFNIKALQKLLKDNPSAKHMANDLLQVAIADPTFYVQAYHHDGDFTDLNSLRGYHQACLSYIQNDLETDPSRLVCSGMSAQVAPPTRLRNSQVDQVIIGHGCILDNARVFNSVLGQNTFVGKGSRIANSVIMGASGVQPMVTRDQVRQEGYLQQEIGENVDLRNAVFDYDVVVGDNCQLLNTGNVQEADLLDRFGLRISEGLIVAARGAHVPPGTCV